MKYLFNAKIYIFAAIVLAIFNIDKGYAQKLSVIQKSNKTYISLPDSLLGRDLLFGARVTSLSRQYNISAGLTLHNPIVVRLNKAPKKNLIEMHQMITKAIWSKKDPSAHIMQRNNVWPVIHIFHSSTDQPNHTLIDVTDYFSNDVAEVSPLPRGIKQGRLEKSVSGIQKVQQLPNRINITNRLVFVGGRFPLTTELTYTLMVLPKKPMRPRYADERVNYFDSSKKLFDTSKAAVQSLSYAHRWRIEPKTKDIARWKAGELVEPKKPIVYYFDPSTPTLIKKYAKQGILAWNKAFEEIGFKNVMRVKDFPKGTFISEDMGVNVFRYIPIDKANASGPCWTDPRSGEIIQADIIWWHNVVDLLQTWRFVQTSAVDPAARQAELPEDVLGPMIRYAVAHETGHTLGLKHNFRGSYCYSPELLRDPEFTQKFGTSSSIMDYARFNFVAQPGDLEKGVQLLPPLLGLQDKFAIKWGYTPTNEMSKKAEKDFLNEMFLAHKGDPIYLHAPSESRAITLDPSAQSEQLGNDLLVSTEYGIKNLKETMYHLKDWTVEKNESYARMKKMYLAIVKQFYSFLTADAAYIGGIYHFSGVAGEFKENYKKVPLKKQKEALEFVITHMKDAPRWLSDEPLRPYIGRQKDWEAKQQRLLKNLVDINFLVRVDESEYEVTDYLDDLTDLILKHVSRRDKLSRKNKENLEIYYASLLNENLESINKQIKSGNVSANLIEGLTEAMNHMRIANYYVRVNFVDKYVPGNYFSKSFDKD